MQVAGVNPTDAARGTVAIPLRLGAEAGDGSGDGAREPSSRFAR